jgi:hypothetical protein
MAFVYQHRRKDTNEVFYIGIGSNKKRAYIYGRNPHWDRIVDKYGYEVDILIEGCSWEEACDIEKGMIANYGRADLCLGPLVNMTNGGDGVTGVIMPESVSLRMKENNPSTHENVKEKLRRSWTKERKEKQGKQQSEFMLSISKQLTERMSGNKNPSAIYGAWNKDKKGDKQKIVTCPYCEKGGGVSNMKRWHFENCKYKK